MFATSGGVANRIGASSPFVKPDRQPRFGGWAAGPIQQIVLQPKRTEWDLGYRGVVRQLHQVGQEEGFDVLLNGHHTGPATTPEGRINSIIEGHPYTMWGQDDKLFLRDPESNAERLGLPMRFDPDYQQPAPLAGHLGIPAHVMKSQVDGGNVFVGYNKADNTLWGMVGKESVSETALLLAADDIGVNLRQYQQAEKSRSPQYRTDLEACQAALKKKTRLYMNRAKEQIAQELNVPLKNLTMISQPAFHIDMMVRPLNDKTVLVNDFKLGEKLLKTVRGSIRDYGPDVEFAQRKLEKIEENIPYFKRSLEKKEYATCDAVARELKKAGFTVIRVPGVFPSERWGEVDNRERTINFLNAFVHQRISGDRSGSLVYISNESNLPELNAAFKNVMLTLKTPEKGAASRPLNLFRDAEKDIRLIGGDLDDSEYEPVNYMSSKLSGQMGGIHCLGAERMQPFSCWA